MDEGHDPAEEKLGHIIRVLSRCLGEPYWLVIITLLAGCATTERNNELVDVQKVIPGIILDIRYATTNNFTGQQLYPVARCCLRRRTR